MKKIILITSIIIYYVQSISAQYVTIPDVDLRNALKALHPSCFNASGMMDTTCSGIVNETTLKLSNKNIHYLDGIEYFDELDTLDCSKNVINYITKLPPTLVHFTCSYNRLTTFPKLPSSLTTLVCLFNEISMLPTLPKTLIYLDCYYNKLTSLPELPNTMTYLDCSFNKLTNLPTLPVSLISLNCKSNELSTLPSLPTFLEQLYCATNRLTSLPKLPDFMYVLLAFDNCYGTPPSNPGIFRFSVSPNREDCITNVFDSKTITKGSLFPNPTKNTIYLNELSLTTASAHLINSSGMSIGDVTILNDSIDASILEPGVYFLQLQTENGIVTQKFIKE